MVWICRHRAAPEDLAHVLPRLVPRKGSQEAQALDSQDDAQSSCEVRLAEEDMQRLRLMQREYARIFERQRLRVSQQSIICYC